MCSQHSQIDVVLDLEKNRFLGRLRFEALQHCFELFELVLPDDDHSGKHDSHESRAPWCPLKASVKEYAFGSVAAGDEDEERNAGGEGDGGAECGGGEGNGLASQDLINEELLPDGRQEDEPE